MQLANIFQFARNRLFFLCIFVVAFFFLSNPIFSPAQTNVIKVIEIKGNIRVRTQDILSRVSSKTGDIYNPYRLDQDLKAIYDLGYFSDVLLETRETPEGVEVCFIVKENPVLEDIIFEGNKAFSSRRLKRELGFKKGELLKVDSAEFYTRKLKRIYSEKNYSLEIASEIQKIAEDKVNLVFKLKEEKLPRILEVKVFGNFSIPTKEIKEILRSRPSWLIFKRYYDKSIVEEDRLRVENLYKDKGFLKVKVVLEEPEYLPEKNGVIIKLKILEEGPQYKVGKIQVVGNTLFSNEEIDKCIKLRSGMTYNQSERNQDERRIFELYADEGYILSEVKPILHINEETHVVDIVYTIKESSRIYVSDIKIKGISFDEEKKVTEVPLKTKEKVILREVTLKKGDVFSKREAMITEEKLYRLGYFEEIKITPRPTLEADKMDLEIALVERKTGALSFGAGYSTERKGEAFLDLTETNLFGTGRKIALKTVLAQEGSEYKFSFTEPYLFDTPLSATFELYKNVLERSYEGISYSYDPVTGVITYSSLTSHEYQEKERGGAITFSYPIRENTRITFRLKHKKTELVPEETNLILPYPLGPTCSITNSITPGIVFDTRDNFLWPTKGTKCVFYVECAGDFLGGDNSYLKYYGEASKYLKIDNKTIIAFRLRGGYIDPIEGEEEIPISDRFFLGGAESMRGFDYRGITPRLLYDDKINHEIVELAVGGNVMVNFNFEIRRRLYKWLYGIIFLDGGAVWENSDKIEAEELRYSSGPALVFRLPVGYFQLGYGIPLKKESYDEEERVFFTFGSAF